MFIEQERSYLSLNKLKRSEDFMNTALEPKTGNNLTGAHVAPEESLETMKGAEEYTVVLTDNEETIVTNRIRYIKEADPIGSIPRTDHPVLMDKLSERAAFERTGTRLYEALISKYLAMEDDKDLKLLPVLEKFHLEEKEHFQMVSEAIDFLGGDPTAMSPAADIAGVAACGWVQVLTDPRTTFKHGLEIILQAELVDNASWEMLIEMVKGMKLNKLAEKFKVALEEENFHLQTIKQWLNDLTLSPKANTLS